MNWVVREIAIPSKFFRACLFAVDAGSRRCFKLLAAWAEHQGCFYNNRFRA